MSLMVIFFTLIANIVMLNMLIAIMGESYARVRVNIGDRQLLERARLILEEQDLRVYGDKLTEALEDLLAQMLPCLKPRLARRRSQQRGEDAWFPSWLHCMVRRKYTAETERGAIDELREMVYEMRIQGERERTAISQAVNQLVKAQQRQATAGT